MTLLPSTFPFYRKLKQPKETFHRCTQLSTPSTCTYVQASALLTQALNVDLPLLKGEPSFCAPDPSSLTCPLTVPAILPSPLTSSMLPSLLDLSQQPTHVSLLLWKATAATKTSLAPSSSYYSISLPPCIPHFFQKVGYTWFLLFLSSHSPESSPVPPRDLLIYSKKTLLNEISQWPLPR